MAQRRYLLGHPDCSLFWPIPAFHSTSKADSTSFFYPVQITFWIWPAKKLNTLQKVANFLACHQLVTMSNPGKVKNEVGNKKKFELRMSWGIKRMNFWAIFYASNRPETSHQFAEKKLLVLKDFWNKLLPKFSVSNKNMKKKILAKSIFRQISFFI